MKVKIACEGSGLLPIEKIHPFQGKLKILSDKDYERLKNEIINTGFAFPINVWLNPKDKKYYIIGGHQRLKTLIKMQSEGYEIPDLPINSIHASNYKEAKRRILQDTAQYGEMTNYGLNEFALDAEIEMPDIQDSFRFPDIKFELLNNNEDVEIKEKELDENINTENKCPSCGYVW